MGKPLNILVTGHAGHVGRAACAALLARGHSVRGFDLRHAPDLENAIIGDISDFAQLRTAMSRTDVVVHLAATPDDNDFLTRLLPNNIVGLYNVLEGARLAGVRRVILASSGQVVMGHEGPWPVTPDMPCSPRNWYGATKVLAEVAGQVYAYKHGISVIIVRLGWSPRDARQAEELANSARGKDAYLSPGDAGRMVVCAAEAPAHLRYCTVFATSKPLHATRYDLSAARTLLGYAPQDTWPEGMASGG